MKNAARPLEEGDHGPYGEIAGRARSAGLVLLFIPSLAALLTRAEELKGEPLTPEQVLLIRDGAKVLVADPQRADAVERGYTDVDPTDAWESWQTIRGNAE